MDRWSYGYRRNAPEEDLWTMDDLTKFIAETVRYKTRTSIHETVRYQTYNIYCLNCYCTKLTQLFLKPLGYKTYDLLLKLVLKC